MGIETLVERSRACDERQGRGRAALGTEQYVPVGDNGGARRTGGSDLQRTRTWHVANPAEGDRFRCGELRGPHGDDVGENPQAIN